MDILTLKTFFMWCSIINVSMLFIAFFMLIGLKDFVYRIHSRMFPMPKETFMLAFYLFLGIFKMFVLIFNVVPYIVLEIMV